MLAAASLSAALALTVVLALTSLGEAQTYNVVHNFTGGAMEPIRWPA